MHNPKLANAMYTQKKTYFVNPSIPSTDLKCLTACLRTCPFKPPRMKI